MKTAPKGKGLLLLLLTENYRKIRDSILQKRGRVIRPWMKYREILIIEELLTNLQPRRCLEWGAGYSTLYYSRYLPNDSARWKAVERQEECAANVRRMNTDPRVEAVHVPANTYPWIDEYRVGAYADLADYVDYGGKLAPLDFIFCGRPGQGRLPCKSTRVDCGRRDHGAP